MVGHTILNQLSQNFLEKLVLIVEEFSNVDIVDVNGTKKAIGKVNTRLYRKLVKRKYQCK